MPHQFDSKPYGLSLTSSSFFDEWIIRVDGDSVTFQLAAPDGSSLISEKLFTDSGSVSLFNIRSIVENYLRAHESVFADFSARLYNDQGTLVDSCTIHVFYLDRMAAGSDPELFLSENFLTTLLFRRVPPDSALTLYYFDQTEDDDIAAIRYKWRSSLSGPDVHAESFSVGIPAVDHPSIKHLVADQSAMKEDASSKSGLPPSSIEIVEFTVTLNQRSVSCCVDRCLRPLDAFLFRNCFNAMDVAYFPHHTTVKTSVERSSAFINNTTRFYDQRVTREYEVQSGPLTSDEAVWIDQLLCSFQVFRPIPSSDSPASTLFREVIITESTCEMSDADENPNSVKFTWRFADNRPMVFLHSDAGIFSVQYNYVFC